MDVCLIAQMVKHNSISIIYYTELVLDTCSMPSLGGYQHVCAVNSINMACFVKSVKVFESSRACCAFAEARGY